MTQTHSERRRPSDTTPNAGRVGPLRQAMTDRDFDALLAEVRDRSDVTSSGCWLWKGALSDLGYARALRPVVLVHRAVAWANAGFPGDSLVGFPAVHHRCARKSCVNPSHLTPVTALVNHLEAQTRKAFREYQEALKEALRELEPNHRLLRMAYLYELDGVSQIGTTSAEMEPLGARLRRHAKNTAREIRARELEIERFAQVLEAKRLVAAGQTRHAAAAQLRMDLSTLASWEQKLADSGI